MSCTWLATMYAQPYWKCFPPAHTIMWRSMWWVPCSAVCRDPKNVMTEISFIDIAASMHSSCVWQEWESFVLIQSLHLPCPDCCHSISLWACLNKQYRGSIAAHSTARVLHECRSMPGHPCLGRGSWDLLEWSLVQPSAMRVLLSLNAGQLGTMHVFGCITFFTNA